MSVAYHASLKSAIDTISAVLKTTKNALTGERRENLFTIYAEIWVDDLLLCSIIWSVLSVYTV